MADPMRHHIVVIDDHIDHLHFMDTLLLREGYSVAAFTTARDGLAYINRTPVSLVITDVFMPDTDGIEVLRSLRENFPMLSIIGISGQFGQSVYLSQAMAALGARAVFAKPIDCAALLAAVADSCDRMIPDGVSADKACRNHGH